MHTDTYFYFIFFIKRYIEGNPFQCTCDLRQFVLLMQRMRILPNNEANRDEPICSYPSFYTGIQIMNVPYHNLGCDSTSRKYLRNNDTFYDSFKQIITQGQLNKSSKAPIGLSSSTVMIAVFKTKNYIYFLYLYYFSISVRKIKMIMLYSYSNFAFTRKLYVIWHIDFSSNTDCITALHYS